MGKKAKDITGQVFGRLTALESTDKRSSGSIIWKCCCSCDGKTVEVAARNLISGGTKSCGCLQREAASMIGTAKAKDLTGQVFGRLTALEPTDKRSSRIWKCCCSCDGKIVEVAAGSLVSGATQSCGCLRREVSAQSAKDLSGQVFGRLTALEPTNKRSGSSVVWKCRCSCDGKIVEVPSSYLVSGNTKSCGCLKRENATKAGLAHANDLTGQLFGRLTALEPTDKRAGNSIIWKCRCSCDGKIVEVPSTRLVSGNTKSCGCLRHEGKDLTGQVFGRLTALEPTDRRSNGYIIWKCRCACDGKIVEVPSSYLVSGNTRSCGCLHEAFIQHYIAENCIANTDLSQIQRPEAHLHTNNTSGIKGVSWSTAKECWVAHIGFMKKQYHYRTKSFDEAVEKRRQMRAVRDEFLDWWKSLTPEEQQEAAGSEDVVIYQRQQFEKRIKIILEG